MSIQSSRYRSLRVIKRTHTAEIHEATRIGPEDYRQRVMLKRLLPEAAADEAVRNAFFDEARLSGKLSYRGLVPIFDFGLADGLPFLIAEYIDGQNVTDLVALAKDKGEKIPLEVTTFVALELIRTVAFLHAATDARGASLGLVHRDLSPNNVLVSWEGDVRVIDLGLARMAGARLPTAIGWTKGTDGFMSPEQGLGRPIGPASDLYSAACVIHYLSTGSSPLEGQAQQIRVFAGQKPKISERIDPELRAILERALAHDPAQRFPSAQAMAEPLWSLLRGRSTSEPVAAFGRWLAPLKPEQTVTRLDGVAGLFDLHLLGDLVAEDSAVRQFTSQSALTPTREVKTPEAPIDPTIAARPKSSPPLEPTPSYIRESRMGNWRWAALTVAVMAVGVVAGIMAAPMLRSLELTGTSVSVAPAAEDQETEVAPPSPVQAEALEALPQVTAIELAIDRPIDPIEPGEPSKGQRPKKVTKPTAATKIDRRGIERALATRGLEPADMSAHPSTAMAWKTFSAAEQKRDDDAAAAAERELLRAIGALSIDDAVLKPKLERAAKHLERSVSGHADGPQLERRFLDLRVAAKRARTDAEREEIAKALLVLEGDLARGAGPR